MIVEMNPFSQEDMLEPGCFCARKQESEVMIETLLQGRNVAVCAPRRMGKRALIRYCFNQPSIKEHYYTLLIDILHTSGSREFAYVLCRDLYATLLRENPPLAAQFLHSLGTLYSKEELGYVADSPAYHLQIGDITDPERTIDEVFRLIARSDRPCIIAINEFQQIAKHPEKRFDVILSGLVHKMENCLFIFGGSDKRVMKDMFLAAGRPFYLSAEMMELEPIPSRFYVPYVVNGFERSGRHIAGSDVERVYNYFNGYTGYMQRLFYRAFARTRRGENCAPDLLRRLIDDMLSCCDTVFREILSNYTVKQKQLLFAIAREGVATKITSNAFIRLYSLESPSAVQSSYKILLERDLVMEYQKSYTLTDHLFALWIKRLYGDDTTI